MNALNKNTRQQAEEKPGGRFRTKDIAITDIYPNGNNFYAMQDVEALAEDIKAVGLLENLTVMYAPQDGKNYRLLGGERRWRALCMLAEQGLTEFATATCQIRTAENERAEIIEIIMCNRQRVKTVWEQIEEERRLKETLQEMRKNGETIKGYNLQEGRLRDTIAVILNYSAAKVGQMETIANNLLPELQDALREEKINFSAAYTIAKMDAAEQAAVLDAYQQAGTVSSTQAREIAEETKEEKRRENAAETGESAAIPQQKAPLSFFGFPATEKEKHPYTYLPGCGDGKYDCRSCCHPCSIRQEERYCRTAPFGNPFSCTQMGEEKRKDMESGLYSDTCQHLHPELAPIREGDKEPEPCCLTCENKTCYSRCDIAKRRDEKEKKEEQEEIRKRQQSMYEVQHPEPTDRDIKAFYDHEKFGPEDDINANGLKEKYQNTGAGNRDFDYRGNARGIRINYKQGISWAKLARRLKEIQEQEREKKQREDEQITGQMSIEDYPEYMPELEAEEELETEPERPATEDEPEPQFTVRFLRDILWDHEYELQQMEECNAAPGGKLPERMMQKHRAVVAGLRLLLEQAVAWEERMREVEEQDDEI